MDVRQGPSSPTAAAQVAAFAPSLAEKFWGVRVSACVRVGSSPSVQKVNKYKEQTEHVRPFCFNLDCLPRGLKTTK